MKQAKLVHIAVRSAEPRSLAQFYQRAFGLKEVLSNRRAVDLWDGYLFLAINTPSATGPMGLNHFGFHVRSNEEMRARAEKAGVAPGARRPDRIPFAEYRVHDPEGNGIDISEKGWKF